MDFFVDVRRKVKRNIIECSSRIKQSEQISMIWSDEKCFRWYVRMVANCRGGLQKNFNGHRDENIDSLTILIKLVSWLVKFIMFSYVVVQLITNEYNIRSTRHWQSIEFECKRKKILDFKSREYRKKTMSANSSIEQFN